MSEISKFFEVLYSHFLLRDIVAKVIPGLLGGFAILYAISCEAYESLLCFIGDSTLLAMIFLYGLGLLLGMLFQYIGSEKIKLIHIHVWRDVPEESIRQYSLERDAEVQILVKDIPMLRNKRERLVILKEMTGNYGFVTLMSTIAIAMRLVIDCSLLLLPWHIFVFGFFLVIGFLLLSQNQSLAREQQEWENILIDKLDPTKQTLNRPSSE